MPELSTIYDYMRCHAALLGERILDEYPALHQFNDAVSLGLKDCYERLFPHRPSPLWESLNAGRRLEPPWWSRNAGRARL
jgi:hypothetical protein